MAFSDFVKSKGKDKPDSKKGAKGGKMDPKKLAALKKFAGKTKNKKLAAKVKAAEAASDGG